MGCACSWAKRCNPSFDRPSGGALHLRPRSKGCGGPGCGEVPAPEDDVRDPHILAIRWEDGGGRACTPRLRRSLHQEPEPAVPLLHNPGFPVHRITLAFARVFALLTPARYGGLLQSWQHGVVAQIITIVTKVRGAVRPTTTATRERLTGRNAQEAYRPPLALRHRKRVASLPSRFRPRSLDVVDAC